MGLLKQKIAKAIANRKLLSDSGFDQNSKSLEYSNHLLKNSQSYQHKAGNDITKYYCRVLFNFISSYFTLPSANFSLNSTRKMKLRNCLIQDLKEIAQSQNKYSQTELPKARNKALGSLKEFLSFFSYRNAEMTEFTVKLKRIEESNDLDELRNSICPQIVKCIKQNGDKCFTGNSIDDSISILKRRMIERGRNSSQQLVSLFEKMFSSLEEFYGDVLRTYTMNTTLNKKVNQYLANESWMELDNLLPYVVCLFKAFIYLRHKKPEIYQHSESMTLYRGTVLDEFELKSFDTNSCKTFSWNCCTSTSKSVTIAEKFMYFQTDIQRKKYPVLFCIEVSLPDYASKLDSFQWIDVQEYSIVPEEQEIILSPGSVFELQEVSTDYKTKTTTIRLKLLKELRSLAYQGFIMQGALHSEILTDRKVKMFCLDDKELDEVVKVIAGNKLIEEVEYNLCTFDHNSLKQMCKTFSTMDSIKKIKFVSCSFKDQGTKLKINETSGNIRDLKSKQLEIYETNEFYKIFGCEMTGSDKNWESLGELGIIFTHPMSKEINNLNSHGLCHFPQLMSLNLNFSQCSKITNKGLESLSYQVLQNCIQLRSLDLNFSECTEITDKGLSSLCESGLQDLIQLTSLNLNFSWCSKITDKGLETLALQGLDYLKHLTSLNLNFSWCQLIKNEGVKELWSQGIKNLSQLLSIVFNFEGLDIITDDGLKIINSEELDHISQLISLNLSFSKCKQITDNGVSNLCSERLQHLQNLTSLNLNFKGCLEISEKGINYLCLQGLRYLSQLTTLSLNFSDCFQMTDKEINQLCVQGFQSHPQLTSLSLNFSECSEISDEALQVLCSKGLQHLTHLRSLSLDFSWCLDITDIGMKHLCQEELHHLNKLKSLSLIFRYCEQITDEGMNYLWKKGLQHFTQLESLDLNFGGISEITENVLQTLSSKVLPCLLQLTSLNLNFQECSQITDKSVKGLTPPKINFLKNLKHLNLDFDNCPKLLNSNNLEIKSYRQILNAKAPLKLFSRKILDTPGPSLDKQSPEMSSNGDSVDHNFKGIDYIESLSELVYNHDNLTEFPPNFSSKESIFSESESAQNILRSRIENLDFLQNVELEDHEFRNQDSLEVQHLNSSTSSENDSSENRLIVNQSGTLLGSQRLKSMDKLTSLKFNFDQNHEITDIEVNKLAQGLKHLGQLKCLSLSFSGCRKITDQEVKYLAMQGLKNLKKLTSLNLDFSQCERITNKGIKNLASQGLKNLTQLVSLKLTFKELSSITDEGLKDLCSQGLCQLSQLKSLGLNFERWGGITDEGVKSLCSKGISHLNQLTALELNFALCWRITDDAVNNIISHGLKYVYGLQTVMFNLEGCPNISNFTRLGLIRVLRCFGFDVFSSEPEAWRFGC